MSPHDLNAALCKAFGLDPAQVAEVDIALRIGKLPEVRVVRKLIEADGIVERIEYLQLRPTYCDLVA